MSNAGHGQREGQRGANLQFWRFSNQSGVRICIPTSAQHGADRDAREPVFSNGPGWPFTHRGQECPGQRRTGLWVACS